ncbi:hypothetical protein Tco_0266858 [Tanacetum coccineum]
MHWGIITSTNVDYAELIWEEFVQAMQTFLTNKANLDSPTKKGRKDKPHVIPYCRFTKLIICHLGRIHNIHQRSASLFHLAEEDLRLGNLKFVSKGEIDEVFGMPIPNELISNNISNVSYYNAYLEMVVKHDQKVDAEKEGKRKSTSTKQPKPKPAIEKSSKSAPAPKPKVTKLVDEPGEEPAHSEPEPEHQGEGEEFDMERAIQMSLESFQAQGHARVRGVAIQEPIAEAIRPLPVVEGKDAETKAESDKTNSGGDIERYWQIAKNRRRCTNQAGSDPGESLESRTQPEQVYMDEDQAGPDPGISRIALAGPDPEPMHNEFMADLYPKVQESLNFSADEHVILEDPLSSTGTLSSMKNLKDAYAIMDQFINDKSTDDEPGKLNVEAEVVFMVTVPIYQASSLPTTTTPLPPPPQQQSTTESELTERVATLEKKLYDLEQTNKNLDNTTRNLRSRVYTLELRDLPHKIDEAVHENVTRVVQIAHSTPMFETGSYKSLLGHVALYKALEAFMERAQRGEFLDEKDKSYKRRRDDQDPLPPPPDSDLNAPSSSSKQQFGPHAEQPVEDIPTPDSANISNSQDTDSVHLPKIKQRSEWLKPIPDDERLATPEPTWVILTSHIPDAENNWANALASTYQAPVENSLLENTWDMRTFMNWYCQKMGKTELTQADLEGQAYEIDWANPEGDQVRIDISKPLPFNGPPVESSHKVVRTHMRILSVVRIKAYSRYGYDYLKEITLHRADHQEYIIAEKDFKNLYPSDFEDLNLLLLQGHLNHLPSSDIRMRSIAIKLNNEWKIMRFNEIYKFSDGTLTNIMEALDYRVKEYKVNRLNPGMNMRFWTDKDVERSKKFIHAIERRLKTRRIFRNLECFIGGRRYKVGKVRSKCENKGIVPTEMELELEQTQQGSSHEVSLVDIKKVAVCSSLRSLKPKRTIESRAKRSSINLIRTLFYITCSSHNVKTRVIIRVLRIILVVLLEHPSDTYVFTMKMEILLEPTSNKLMVGDSDVHTLEDSTLTLEILSRRFFLRLNLPDHRTSRTTNNQAFTIKKGMSMPVQMSPTQDGKRPKVDDQRLYLADDLKEAQDHISSTITSHTTKITTSMYKISHEEPKTMS